MGLAGARASGGRAGRHVHARPVVVRVRPVRQHQITGAVHVEERCAVLVLCSALHGGRQPRNHLIAPLSRGTRRYCALRMTPLVCGPAAMWARHWVVVRSPGLHWTGADPMESFPQDHDNAVEGRVLGAPPQVVGVRCPCAPLARDSFEFRLILPISNEIRDDID